MNIGDKVKVKFHPSKDWEPIAYQVVSIYLNDVIVKPWDTRHSCRTIHKDLVQEYENN
jgi:hypothetical protein